VKLVQLATSAAGSAPGVLLDDGAVVPVATLLGADAPGSVRALLAGGEGLLERVRQGLEAGDGAPIPADRVALDTPLGRQVLVVCAGANYRDHVEEMGPALPGNSLWFIKNPNAIVGPGAAIELPADAPEQVDWEGELAVVFGKPCHAVAAEDAWDHLAGFTLLNDVSARDGVPAMVAAMGSDGAGAACLIAGVHMFLGKQYPTFGPLGPAVVTLDEVPDVGAVRLTTTVSGQRMQDALVGDLTVDIPHLVEAYSRYFRFEPGDVISTGSPAGAGAAQQPPRFLADGDVVTVAATGIGELTNPVARRH
jgi:2-keto-4-pentenoate hydratase/2-oxohepta-3-ene-1,7-dioic acid hydratase in catechol pathway